MKTEYKNVIFNCAHKEKIWYCTGTKSSVLLGNIQWHKLMKEFVFFPTPGIILNTGIMEDANSFIYGLTEAKYAK